MSIKEVFEQVIDLANQLEGMGYYRYADLLDAITKNLSKEDGGKAKSEERREEKHEDKHEDKKDNHETTDTPERVKEESKQIKDDMTVVRKKIVDDKDIKDLFEAKEQLTKLKNSGQYELTEDEWSKIYGQILEDRFRREYSEKGKEELEKELNRLLEDKKRKGELNKEEELDYKMIDEIYQQKSHEEVRPSDKS